MTDSRKSLIVCLDCELKGHYVPLTLLNVDLLLRHLSVGCEFAMFRCLRCGDAIVVEAADPTDEFEDWPF